PISTPYVSYLITSACFRKTIRRTAELVLILDGIFTTVVLYWHVSGSGALGALGSSALRFAYQKQWGVSSMRIARSTLVGTAVAMALFGRNGAVRAEAPAESSSDSNTLEEVVVHGYRASLRESLETKRQATGVLDALTAED